MDNRLIGAHIRLNKTITSGVQEAVDQQLDIFQCFLIDEATKKRMYISKQDKQQFLELIPAFKRRVLHGAYWINLASAHAKKAPEMFLKELICASELQFTDYVLHPGAAVGWESKIDGIKKLAEALEKALNTQAVTVRIILENVAHGGSSIGGDLHDFLVLKEHMPSFSKLGFCIDTAHAYVYGYEIDTLDGQKEFINLINQTITPQQVALLHINDTTEKCGSKKDKHEIPGKGLIGEFFLRKFTQHDDFLTVPILFELPLHTMHHVKDLVKMFSS